MASPVAATIAGLWRRFSGLFRRQTKDQPKTDALPDSLEPAPQESPQRTLPDSNPEATSPRQMPDLGSATAPTPAREQIEQQLPEISGSAIPESEERQVTPAKSPLFENIQAETRNTRKGGDIPALPPATQASAPDPRPEMGHVQSDRQPDLPPATAPPVRPQEEQPPPDELPLPDELPEVPADLTPQDTGPEENSPEALREAFRSRMDERGPVTAPIEERRRRIQARQAAKSRARRSRLGLPPESRRMREARQQAFPAPLNPIEDDEEELPDDLPAADEPDAPDIPRDPDAPEVPREPAPPRAPRQQDAGGVPNEQTSSPAAIPEAVAGLDQPDIFPNGLAQAPAAVVPQVAPTGQASRPLPSPVDGGEEEISGGESSKKGDDGISKRQADEIASLLRRIEENTRDTRVATEGVKAAIDALTQEIPNVGVMVE